MADTDTNNTSTNQIQNEPEYSYDSIQGLPVIKKPSEKAPERNRPEWTFQSFRKMIELRNNLQAIYDQTGLNFMSPKPMRNMQELAKTFQTQGNPIDYFNPDPGFILEGEYSRRVRRIEDYIDLVFVDRNADNTGSAPVPDMAEKWDSDETFAYNFLAGPNPNQIQKLVEASAPRELDLASIDLSKVPGFQGDNLTQAIRSGRVFLVDRSDMLELFNKERSYDPSKPDGPNNLPPNATVRMYRNQSGGLKYTYAAMGLFGVPKGGQKLLPIAIQCGLKSQGHKPYTPADGYAWKMARVCLLAAHNNHHEVISHLGLTHLLVDPILIATRLRLPNTHPIAVLLTPHFEGTAAINVSARTSLIQPERSVDRLIGSKIEANYPYLVRQRREFSFRDNFLPARLNRMGVTTDSAIATYPYRDDAIRVWNAIKRWMSAYVPMCYPNEAAFQADLAIKSWAREIQDVGQVKNFCSANGEIASRDELIDLLTMIIFTAGPQHAAVNFSQGIEMLHVPTNPMAGYRQAPRHSEGKVYTMSDLLDILPPIDVAVHSWAMLSFLAGIRTNVLGDYRGAFDKQANIKAALDAFNNELRSIEASIDASNKKRKQLYGLEYIHLKPSRIPASINI